MKMISFREIWSVSRDLNRELSGVVTDKEQRYGEVLHRGHEQLVLIDQTSQNTFHTHITMDESIRSNIERFGCDVPSFNDYTAFVSKGYHLRSTYKNISDTVVSQYGEAQFTVDTSFFKDWNEENLIQNLLIVQAYFYWLSGLSNVHFLNKEQYLKMIHTFRPSFMLKVIDNFMEVEGEQGLKEVLKGFSASNVEPIFLPGKCYQFITDCEKLDNTTGLTLEFRLALNP